MSAYQRLEVTEVGEVTVVRFRNRRITEDIDIQELGSEMFSLVESEHLRGVRHHAAESFLRHQGRRSGCSGRFLDNP